MPRWSLAVVAVAVPAALAEAAAAQVPPPIFPGVTVSPATVSTPGQAITVAGPGTPGEEGCRVGRILAVLPDQNPVEGRLFQQENLDARWTFTQTEFEDGPFAAGTYTIYLDCNDMRGTTILYATEARFTITASAITTSTSTTSTTTSTTSSTPTSDTTQTTSGPAGTTGTVEPTTAKPGATTITIRGGGFRADATLEISLATTPVTAVGRTAARAAGDYAATVTLPVTSPPGVQQLLVTGPGPDGASRSTTATLTVEDLNCPDFDTPEAAQAALGTGDPHGLDDDGDGVACESGSDGAAGSAAAGTDGTASAPSGSLPSTGSQHVTLAVTAGLVSLTFGALFMGLSHPSAPATAAGHHRRRRRGAHLR